METSTPSDRKRKGFTLVEVTIAMGVVAFGFITILGLLPAGLKTFRSAMDSSVGAQIAQKVINDAQQKDFDALVANGIASTVRYFDDQGNELGVSDKAKAIYHVNTRVVTATGMPGAASNSNLATITIQIANNPGNLTLPAESSLWTQGAMNMGTFSTQISRSK
jgi:uncharacterized protein (TIGR02598 family)